MAIFRATEVCLHDPHARANRVEFLRERLRLAFAAAVMNRDGRPLVGERARDGPPDSARTARDDSDAAGEPLARRWRLGRGPLLLDVQCGDPLDINAGSVHAPSPPR